MSIKSTQTLEMTLNDVPILQELLNEAPYTDTKIQEFEVYGTVFGDVLATELGLHWRIVDDEYGTDFALKYQDFSIFIFPRNLIVKRVENGEEVDLTHLFNELKKIVEDKIKEREVQRG